MYHCVKLKASCLQGISSTPIRQMKGNGRTGTQLKQVCVNISRSILRDLNTRVRCLVGSFSSQRSIPDRWVGHRLTYLGIPNMFTPHHSSYPRCVRKLRSGYSARYRERAYRAASLTNVLAYYRHSQHAQVTANLYHGLMIFFGLSPLVGPFWLDQ